jgi:hypothetical protein
MSRATRSSGVPLMGLLPVPKRSRACPPCAPCPNAPARIASAPRRVVSRPPPLVLSPSPSPSPARVSRASSSAWNVYHGRAQSSLGRSPSPRRRSASPAASRSASPAAPRAASPAAAPRARKPAAPRARKPAAPRAASPAAPRAASPAAAPRVRKARAAPRKITIEEARAAFEKYYTENKISRGPRKGLPRYKQPVRSKSYDAKYSTRADRVIDDARYLTNPRRYDFAGVDTGIVRAPSAKQTALYAYLTEHKRIPKGHKF